MLVLAAKGDSPIFAAKTRVGGTTFAAPRKLGQSPVNSYSLRNRSASGRTTALSFALWLRKTSWLKDSVLIITRGWFSDPLGFCPAGIKGAFADGVEADCAFRLGGRGREFADGVEEGFDRSVVAFEAALQLDEFPREVLVARQHPSQTDERAHDGDVDLHGALAPQHAGEHCHALLGEGVGVVPTSAAMF